MPSHKDFLHEFQKNLPLFLQDKTKVIYTDITSLMAQALKEDGIEIRGSFSMKASTKNVRNIITFKDLTSQQLLEQE